MDPFLDLSHPWAPQGSPRPCCCPEGDAIPRSLGVVLPNMSLPPSKGEEGPWLNLLTVLGKSSKLLGPDHCLLRPSRCVPDNPAGTEGDPSSERSHHSLFLQKLLQVAHLSYSQALRERANPASLAAPCTSERWFVSRKKTGSARVCNGALVEALQLCCATTLQPFPPL